MRTKVAGVAGPLSVLALAVACSAQPAPGAGLAAGDAATEAGLDGGSDSLADAVTLDAAAGNEAQTADVQSLDAASAESAAGDAAPSLCELPAGTLFEHGTFEEGMAGLAPAGWELRAPELPTGTCSGSGQPEQHVFLSEGPTGCGGHALSIDGRGTWDCFAVQRVSGYNSIHGGARYRVQAAVRSQGNAPDGAVCPECAAAWFILGVQWLNAADGFFGDEKNLKPADPALHDHDWQLVSFELVAPQEATRMLVWLTAHYPGRVDYDNVAVVEVP